MYWNKKWRLSLPGPLALLRACVSAVNPAAGEYSTSPAFYNDFRYQRRPDEQFSIGREFPLGAGRRVLSLRAEFFNAFNRLLEEWRERGAMEGLEIDRA